MQISYLGHSCFKIKTKTATVITDPYSKEKLDFKLPKVEADIVTVSHNHPDHNFVEGVAGNPFIITGPGEYEIKEVMIQGIASFHDNQSGADRGSNIIYVISAEELSLCHLGDLGHRLTPKLLEQIGDIDVLFVPSSWSKSLEPKAAVEVVNQIEPRIVIPMHYRTDLHDQTYYKEMATVEDFLREMGAEKKLEEKLILSKSTLGEELEVIVLKPRP